MILYVMYFRIELLSIGNDIVKMIEYEDELNLLSTVELENTGQQLLDKLSSTSQMIENKVVQLEDNNNIYTVKLTYELNLPFINLLEYNNKNFLGNINIKKQVIKRSD